MQNAMHARCNLVNLKLIRNTRAGLSAVGLPRDKSLLYCSHPAPTEVKAGGSSEFKESMLHYFACLPSCDSITHRSAPIDYCI